MYNAATTATYSAVIHTAVMCPAEMCTENMYTAVIYSEIICPAVENIAVTYKIDTYITDIINSVLKMAI